MVFRVEVSPQALADLDAIAGYLRSHGGRAVAERWFNGILSEIASLQEMPERCPVAPESVEVGREVRVLLHGRKNRTYKIYFGVEQTAGGGIVRVFHVRHWARAPIAGVEGESLV